MGVKYQLCSMGFFQDYVDYFKNKWEAHPDSGGAVANNFMTIDIEEALGEFRSRLKDDDFVFLLIHYTTERPPYNVNAEIERQCGFYIMKKYSPRKDDDYVAALDEAERVGWELMNSVVVDSEAGHSLLQYSLNSDADIKANHTLKSFAPSHVGWLFMFTIRSHAPIC